MKICVVVMETATAGDAFVNVYRKHGVIIVRITKPLNPTPSRYHYGEYPQATTMPNQMAKNLIIEIRGLCPFVSAAHFKHEAEAETRN